MCYYNVYLAGDAMDNGSLNELYLTMGIFGSKSWCFDGDGNLYFWGTNGIYKTTIPGTPKCISEIRLPNLVNDEDADPSTHRITLGYDRLKSGIVICITKLADGSNSNYFYDLRVSSLFPETYPDECACYAQLFYSANNNAYKDLLIAGKDGYIRKFDPTAKSDDVGASDQAIDSYVTQGPIPMADDPKFEGKLVGLDAVTAGGAAGGSQSDSDDIIFDVWAGKSAAEIIEKLSADTNPNVAGTIIAPGRRRGSNIKRKVKGVYLGIKLQNNTAGETWGYEQLLIDLKKSGRFK